MGRASRARQAAEQAAPPEQKAARAAERANAERNPARALPLFDEAIRQYERLEAESPGRYPLELAQLLHRNALTLIAGQQGQKGAVKAAEAYARFQQAQQQGIDVQAGELAHATTTYAIGHGLMGTHDQAAHYAEEAAALWQPLADAEADAKVPDQFEARAGLAMALDEQTKALRQLARFEEAIGTGERAAAVLRQLVATVRVDELGDLLTRVHESQLARVLRHIVECQCALKRGADAYPVCDEAIAIERRLATDLPYGAQEPWLPMLLRLRAQLASQAQDDEAASRLLEEALIILAPTFRLDPEPLVPEVSLLTMNYIDVQTRLGRKTNSSLLQPYIARLMQRHGMNFS